MGPTSTKIGLLQTYVYGANPSVCRDVTSGNNGAYSASTGWDATTGLGVPIGTSVLSVVVPVGAVDPVPQPPPTQGGNGPVAAFTFSPQTGTAPLRVTFTDQTQGSPTSWSWDFGDGQTSSAQNPTHTYTNAGKYAVSLTATNSNGSNTVTQTDAITVVQAATLKANFRADKTSGRRPLRVSFYDTSTGTPFQWRWSFSDGTSSTQRNPVKTFSRPGTYTVSLTVRNSRGQSSTETKSRYITVN